MDDLPFCVVIKPLRRGVPLRNRRTVILFSESMISILSDKFVTRRKILAGVCWSDWTRPVSLKAVTGRFVGPLKTPLVLSKFVA